MNKDKVIRQEASAPVQSRVDVRVIATLDEYWNSRGVQIKSVSQLVSWSLELCREILIHNGKIGEGPKRVGEAYKYLSSRGLTQRGMEKKMLMARGFDEMRMEGFEPKEEYPEKFEIMHRGSEIEVYPRRINDLVDTYQQKTREQMDAEEERLRKKNEEYEKKLKKM